MHGGCLALLVALVSSGHATVYPASTPTPVLRLQLVASDLAIIEISLSHRIVAAYRSGNLCFSAPCAIGAKTDRTSTVTPTGWFAITEKDLRSKDEKDKRYGTRWMALSAPRAPDGKRFGIHGTSEPHLIGQAVSRGCIRLSNDDAERLYELVTIGTPVHIVP